jgi:hypothetical protein
MATVVVEDGSGKSNANSYISVADADTYFEKHLYASDWSGASAANQAIAVMMATRLLDDYFKFEGQKVDDSQALEFPRFNITDRSGFLVDAATLPAELPEATAELAKWMIASDRTADASGKGFKRLKAGSLTMEPDTGDKAPVIPDVVSKMLVAIATPIGGAIAEVVR